MKFLQGEAELQAKCSELKNNLDGLQVEQRHTHAIIIGIIFHDVQFHSVLYHIVHPDFVH